MDFTDEKDFSTQSRQVAKTQRRNPDSESGAPLRLRAFAFNNRVSIGPKFLWLRLCRAAFFVVKELFMRWRMSDFFTSDNGGASRFRVGVFSLFDPVSTLPNQYAFPCPRKAVFVRVLRLFAANQHNLLSINNLQQKSRFSN
jgi:hypothetical protein